MSQAGPSTSIGTPFLIGWHHFWLLEVLSESSLLWTKDGLSKRCLSFTAEAFGSVPLLRTDESRFQSAANELLDWGMILAENIDEPIGGLYRSDKIILESSLTEFGQLAWQQVARPCWSRFVHQFSTGDETESPQVEINSTKSDEVINNSYYLIAGSTQRMEEFLRYELLRLEQNVTVVNVKVEPPVEVENCELLYWYISPIGYRAKITHQTRPHTGPLPEPRPRPFFDSRWKYRSISCRWEMSSLVVTSDRTEKFVIDPNRPYLSEIDKDKWELDTGGAMFH